MRVNIFNTLGACGVEKGEGISYVLTEPRTERKGFSPERSKRTIQTASCRDIGWSAYLLASLADVRGSVST